jgi:hypothetical protein
MTDRKKPGEGHKKERDHPPHGVVQPGEGGSKNEQDWQTPFRVSQGDTPTGPRKVPGGGTPFPSGSDTETE